MKNHQKTFLITSSVFLFFMSTIQAQIKYPATRKVDQVDDYFGTKVSDPYRWLEDDNAPDTKAWVIAQNKLTFGYLAGIPYRAATLARLQSLTNYVKFTGPFAKNGNV